MVLVSIDAQRELVEEELEIQSWGVGVDTMVHRHLDV